MLTTQEWKLISKHYANPKRFKDPHGKYGKLIPLIEQLEGRTFAERAAMYRNGIASVPRCKCGAMVIFSLASYNWTKTCGQKCYHKNKTHDYKAVVIGDTVYESLTKAMKHYTSGHFYDDLYDCSKPHIRYLNNHEETCITNMGRMRVSKSAIGSLMLMLYLLDAGGKVVRSDQFLIRFE